MCLAFVEDTIVRKVRRTNYKSWAADCVALSILSEAMSTQAVVITFVGFDNRTDNPVVAVSYEPHGHIPM